MLRTTRSGLVLIGRRAAFCLPTADLRLPRWLGRKENSSLTLSTSYFTSITASFPVPSSQFLILRNMASTNSLGARQHARGRRDETWTRHHWPKIEIKIYECQQYFSINVQQKKVNC
ncbi:unnamed protein product [Spodoptera exigua]|nr:unnamed protein product [Spodoptera exigua]